MWQALLVLNMVGFVGFNLRLRTSLLGKTDPLLLATIMQTGIAIPLIPVLLIHPPGTHLFASHDVSYLLTGIVATIGLQLSNAKALQYLEASVYSIVYNLRIPLTAVLGIIVLHEKFLWLRIMGGLLIFSAIFIVQQTGKHSLTALGLRWGFMAVAAIGILNVSEKTLALRGGFWYYFPTQSIITMVIMWLYMLRQQRLPKRQVLLQSDMLQLMTFRALSAYGFSGALAAGAIISVANYISGLSVIVMVVLGVMLLGERDYLRRKIISVVLALAGLTIILIGGST